MALCFSRRSFFCFCCFSLFLLFLLFCSLYFLYFFPYIFVCKLFFPFPFRFFFFFNFYLFIYFIGSIYVFFFVCNVFVRAGSAVPGAKESHGHGNAFFPDLRANEGQQHVVSAFRRVECLQKSRAIQKSWTSLESLKGRGGWWRKREGGERRSSFWILALYLDFFFNFRRIFEEYSPLFCFLFNRFSPRHWIPRKEVPQGSGTRVFVERGGGGGRGG